MKTSEVIVRLELLMPWQRDPNDREAVKMAIEALERTEWKAEKVSVIALENPTPTGYRIVTPHFPPVSLEDESA